MVRVAVTPAVLAWAKERSGVDEEALARRFPKLAEWEQGEVQPTLKQLETFAQATHTPVGLLLGDEPPDERVPIPDYRTVADRGVERPSADLLDTSYQCQRRQDWYRSFARLNRAEPVPVVGSLTPATPVVEAAAEMRRALGFDVGSRPSSFAGAMSHLVDAAEALRVLVMVSGIVGSNTRRRLDPAEFRGFALVDPLAPVVFVNGADTKAAQIFTLAHELAHVWTATTALDDADPAAVAADGAERWCNQVAAELLVPLERLSEEFVDGVDLTSELDRLAKHFKASTLVVLRRIHEARFLGADDYWRAFRAERDRVLALAADQPAGGGNFYATQPRRVSKRFARALVASTLEGQTLYTEAFEMLGFRKPSTFEELAARLIER